MVSTTGGGLIKRSTSYEPEVLAWLQGEAQRADRSIDWCVRQILRKAMQADNERAA